MGLELRRSEWQLYVVEHRPIRLGGLRLYIHILLETITYVLVEGYFLVMATRPLLDPFDRL